MKSLFFLALISPLFAQIEALQEAYIKSASHCPCLDENFGEAVAISYPWAVVGAPNEDSDATGINGDPHNENDFGAGAAYVYFHDGSQWTQHTYLKASNPSVSFGTSVAIEGDTIVIGADNEKSNATGVNGDQTDTSLIQAGAVYVFTRDTSDNWSQQAYLKASNTQEGTTIAGSSGALFGSAVAISGDTIIVGAKGEKSNTTGVNGDQSDASLFRAGAAYIFTRDNSGTWSQQAYLKASNTTESDDFGTSVDIDGDIVVIGASSEDSANPGVNPADPSDSPDHQTAGAAYIFSRSGTTWTFRAHLKSAAPQDFGLFGISVSIEGETIAVGAPYEVDQGRTYIFERSGPNWIGKAILTPENNDADQKFGYSVSLSDDNLLIGVLGHAGDAGRADLFRRDPTNSWNHLTEIHPSNPQAGDFFGDAVAIDGFRAIVGAPREDGVNIGVNPEVFDNTNANFGAAYTFNFTRPLEVISFNSARNNHAIIFLAEPGLKGWQLHGDPHLTFRKDYTNITTFTEVSAGRYRASFELDARLNPKHLFRITLPE